MVFVPNDAPRPLFPLWYLFLSPVVLCTQAYVFFREAHPAYSPVALATLVASALAPILLALLCGRREAQKVPSSPVSTRGSAPYEQLPSLVEGAPSTSYVQTQRSSSTTTKKGGYK